MNHSVPLIRQLPQLLLDLIRSIMTHGEQLLPKAVQVTEVILSCINLCFMTLVVVHEELYTGHISRFLACGHLSHQVFHPHDQAPDHGEEPEQVSSVIKFALPGVSHCLEFHPCSEDLTLPVGNLHGLLPSIGSLQLPTVFSDSFHLALQ